MTRDEFLADLKGRALELARAGDLVHAVSMMVVEINRRADTKASHDFVFDGTLKAMNGDSRGVIKWIESMR